MSLSAAGFSGATRVIPDTPQASHQAAIAAAREEHTGALFVLYVGSARPDTGKSWCGDCVRAKPVIVQALSAVKDCLVLEVPIERSAWKDKDRPHFLRKNKWGKVSGVPALVKVGQTARPVGILVEEEIMDAVMLQSLINA